MVPDWLPAAASLKLKSGRKATVSGRRGLPTHRPPLARGPRLSVSESSAKNFALHDPDVRLMLEVRDDSAAAFEELMLRYQNRLITVLEHLVGHRQLAEDLAQDVFLRLYRSRKRYTPGAKFSTYLFTIANNVASNALRDHSAAAKSTSRPAKAKQRGPTAWSRWRWPPAA